MPTVDFEGWEKIDRVETERGKGVGKPREKIVDVAEMLEIGSTVSWTIESGTVNGRQGNLTLWR